MSQLKYDVDGSVPIGITEAELIRAARGLDERIHPTTALQHLQGMGSPKLAGLAAELLAVGGDRRLTQTAVQVAAGLEPRSAQRLLIAHMDTRNPHTLDRAALALARIGAASAMPALERAYNANPNPRLAFARTLLSHRLQLETHLVELPTLAMRLTLDSARAQKITARTRKLTTAEAKSIQAAARGIGAGANGQGVELVCGDNRLLLVVADDFSTASKWATLAKKPGIPLLVFRLGLSLEKPLLIEYFLARPGSQGGEIALVGVHSNGGPAYVCTARRNGASVTFEIDGVAGPYAAPVKIEGSGDPSNMKITLTSALSERIVPRERSGRLRPTPAP